MFMCLCCVDGIAVSVHSPLLHEDVIPVLYPVPARNSGFCGIRWNRTQPLETWLLPLQGFLASIVLFHGLLWHLLKYQH